MLESFTLTKLSFYASVYLLNYVMFIIMQGHTSKIGQNFKAVLGKLCNQNVFFYSCHLSVVSKALPHRKILIHFRWNFGHFVLIWFIVNIHLDNLCITVIIVYIGYKL